MKLHLKVSLIALGFASAPALANSSPAPAGAEQQMQQPGKWVQDYTGRKADPAVVFGTLPNGMRYAIMRNTTPSDGVAMRLRVGSGSIQESDEQQGIAHFLEHMAFRGSRNLADGDVVRMLERLGLRFGPDTNAFTAQDQTVYMFNFPKADMASLDTGLTLFREIGERLTLDPKLVEAEKGVILSEERVRDVPPYRMIKANLGNTLAGTRAVNRWPIGTIESLKAATAGRLRSYYEANYRPDNATLIIVGNIDPAKVEAEIKRRFGDWKPAGTAQQVGLGTPSPTATASEFIAEGAPEILILNWVSPPDKRADTEARDHEQIRRFLALTVFNSRIAERALMPGSAFLGGQAMVNADLMDTASTTEITIAAAPEKWAAALDAIIEEQRLALEAPVTLEELDRAKAQTLAVFQSAADGASTRTNDDLANGLVQSINDDELFVSPSQNLEIIQSVLARVTPDDVAHVLAAMFSGKGPILFRSAQRNPVGVPALEAQLATSSTRPLAARAVQSTIDWPYTSFGTPGEVVSRKVDDALGATTIVFSNGSRLLVKPTAHEKDRVHVNVALGNGRAGTKAELVHALWATGAMPVGGTGKLPAADIQRWAQSGGKLVGLQLRADNRAFEFSSVTRPADLAGQMQLFAAYARDPGFRPEMGEQIAAIKPAIGSQISANAGSVFEREASRLFGDGTTRYSDTPSSADIDATKPEDLVTALKGELAGPADVIMVGDIDVSAAITIMQTTFASGPSAEVRAVRPVKLSMPQGRVEPFIVFHDGRSDQAVYGAFWALPDYASNPDISEVANVAAAILEARLVATVREQMGLTYSPSASAVSAVRLPGQGYLRVSIETPSSNFDAFSGILSKQLSDLANKPVTPDELERARGPLVEASQKTRESNAWWAANLSTIWREPSIRSWILEERSRLRKVTAADIQALTSRYVSGRQPTVIISRAR